MEKKFRKAIRATCPACGGSKKQVRNGKNPSGSTRVWCKECGKHYTSTPKRNGHDWDRVEDVLIEYLKQRIILIRGSSNLIQHIDNPERRLLPLPSPKHRLYRKVARIHRVHHETVKAWVMKWYASELTIDEYLDRAKKI
jgi:hypothetical protein